VAQAIIRRTPAIDELVDTIRLTLAVARTRGGAWQKLAEERLSPIDKIITKIEGAQSTLEKTLEPLEAEVDAIDKKADHLISETADEIWNRLGRPRFDPIYSLLFPEGISTYTDVEDEEQPDYMHLLADLLQSGIHPRLDGEYAKTAASAIEAMADQYRTALHAAIPHRIRGKLLEKTRATVARNGQAQLAQLKRLYRAEGFDDAQIAQVIPEKRAPLSEGR